MAKKRMFSLGVLDTDAFLDMPLSAQALYFHLNLRADDDGFIGSPKRVAKIIGASDDDLKLLVAKRFVIAFEDGVIVIKHWRMHNAIRKDRYLQTNFFDDLKALKLKPNGSYTLDGNYPGIEYLGDPENEIQDDDIPDDNQMATNDIPDGNQMPQTSASDIDIGIGLDIDKDKQNNKGVDLKPKEIVYADDVAAIPIIDGSDWRVPLDYYEECKKNYPSVDVKREFSKMRMWSLSNPNKKKTKNGVKRFINSWLGREQDKYHSNEQVAQISTSESNGQLKRELQ